MAFETLDACVCVFVTGYYEYQFSGVMKRVRLNGQSVNLSDLPIHGHAEVVPCSSVEVQDFIDHMKEEQQEQDYIQQYGRP